MPEEYAGDKDVKAALVKSAFVTETWRYEILHFADEFVSDPSKTARELLTRAYGDEPYPIW